MGVRVVCINNEKIAGDGTLPITVGKIYEGTIESYDNGSLFYLIEDELGHRRSYYGTRFLTIERWREARLKEIGILCEAEIPQKSGI